MTQTRLRRILLGAGALLAVYGAVRWRRGRPILAGYDPKDPGHATITTAFDREEVDTVLIVAGFLIFLGVVTPQIWRQVAAGYAQMRDR